MESMESVICGLRPHTGRLCESEHCSDPRSPATEYKIMMAMKDGRCEYSYRMHICRTCAEFIYAHDCVQYRRPHPSEALP